MSIEDIEVALEIENECFSPKEAFSRYEYERLLKSPDVIMFKAISEGTIAGFVVGLVHHREAEVHTINVRMESRRRGVATGVIQILETQFLELGCKTAVAEISPDNVASKRLFEKLGYRNVRYLPGFYSRGRSAILVEKLLTQNSN